ncbi:hypothetical protein BU26DRAFT_514126 [Trematosphaeria pertusa]|uniref:Uncharacterized protein n=1 Tax=Trematosphaeria pertusa TaxID=390896 RepID=A0A6A6J3P2_9PLEO|nr:uncharacterized protein BU26DRAFT_514126 [Trematosphaeria pertusa]KAF2257445.1 hypothetical protein BU26DRAFT_514126 [Trematosphaeria pertusa]
MHAPITSHKKLLHKRRWQESALPRRSPVTAPETALPTNKARPRTKLVRAASLDNTSGEKQGRGGRKSWQTKFAIAVEVCTASDSPRPFIPDAESGLARYPSGRDLGIVKVSRGTTRIEAKRDGEIYRDTVTNRTGPLFSRVRRSLVRFRHCGILAAKVTEPVVRRRGSDGAFGSVSTRVCIITVVLEVGMDSLTGFDAR